MHLGLLMRGEAGDCEGARAASLTGRPAVGELQAVVHTRIHLHTQIKVHSSLTWIFSMNSIDAEPSTAARCEIMHMVS